MRKIRFLICLSIILSLVSVGCSQSYKLLGISDVMGTWEGISAGYYLLEIDKIGKGHFVHIKSNKSVEAYQISRITFLMGSFQLILKSSTDKQKTLQLESYFVDKNTIVLADMANESKKPCELLFLTKNTAIPDLRIKANETIESLGQ